MSVSLANELGIDVVAEGVASDEQSKFLISAGCKYAQGHAFGDALPADSMAELLRQKF